MSKKTKEYLAVSNFFKNSEGYSREILKEIITDLIEEKIKEELKNYFETNDFKYLIYKITPNMIDNFVKNAIYQKVTESLKIDVSFKGEKLN